MNNTYFVCISLFTLLFSSLATSETSYSNPFQELILEGNNSIGLSEDLNEKRYESLLRSADYRIDLAIVSLSNSLDLFIGSPLEKQVRHFLSNAKIHRNKYPSTAKDSDVYQQALSALETIEVLPPEFSEKEMREKTNEIIKRLDNLKKKIAEEEF